MATFRTRPAATVLLIASLLHLATAHEHHEDAIPEGSTISPDPIDAILWAHILIQIFAWGILFPTGMVLGLVKSRWHVPCQTLASSLAIVGYFLGHLHKGRQFSANVHSHFANWLMFMLVGQVVMGVYLRLHLEKGFQGKMRKWIVRGHGILGAVIPVAAWVQMLFGGIAAMGFCHGDHLGQCLAHFIMGSAFVGYGIVMTILLLNGQHFLARTGRSQEFWDSSIIAAWGVVNTFTEHRWGGAWVGNDIQHTTMGVIWWAAGLVGVWLSRDRHGRPKRNVIPGMVILLTGYAMSAHPQELMLSTKVHSVFGYTLMSAGISRIIEISFILRDRPTLVNMASTAADEGGAEVNSFQFLPPFLLYASGFLFMGATEEQMHMLSDAGVTHVSYVLVLYSIAFLVFLFTLMLLQLYAAYTAPAAVPKKSTDAEANGHLNGHLNGHADGHANGHARAPLGVGADRQMRDAEEFELEGLMSDDEDEPKTNGHVL